MWRLWFLFSKSSLLLDVDSIRHATLQNRAAIEFLFLAQGHGCEDFEGMCCMNLSDHSESIHKSIQILKYGVQKLQVLSEWDWFQRLLHGWGISSWLGALIKQGLMIEITLTVAVLIFCCLRKCIVRMITHAMNQVWVAQKEKGGIVEEFLEANWHSVLMQAYLHNPAYEPVDRLSVSLKQANQGAEPKPTG